MTTINTLNTNELTNFNAPYATKPQLKDENNFTNELKTALDNISQLQMQANHSAKAFEMGEPNVSLNEVMVNMQKSSVSLQFGIQVRNKLVSAYQEIMNMNV